MKSDREIEKAHGKLVDLKASLQDHRLNSITLNYKQKLFVSHTARQVYLSGPNQIGGKTTASNNAIMMQLTGDYPPGFPGVKYDRPVRIIAGSTKADKTREVISDRLFGPYNARGTGYLPAHSFDPKKDLIPLMGATKGALKGAYVRHYTDGVFDGMSHIDFISYESGAYNLQASTADWIFLDEEPKQDVYEELKARTNFSRGYLRIVATPTLGHTALRESFKTGEGGRVYIPYTVWDCDHISEEHKLELLEEMGGEENEVALIRLFGDATPGDMRPFPFVKDDLKCDAFDIPPTFGMNIGIDLNHGPSGTFAAVKQAYNEESDQSYTVAVRKRQGATRSEQVDILFSLGGDRIPIEWPHDGSRRMEDGQQIVDYFRSRGLRMQQDHAHRRTSTGSKSNALNPILDEIYERCKDGRHKIFESPDTEVLYEEMRDYVMVDGKPKKKMDDHAIDAWVKSFMGLTWRSASGGDRLMSTRTRERATTFKRSSSFFDRRKSRGRPFSR